MHEPNFSAYESTLANGEVVTVLIQHGAGGYGVDLGQEQTELLGAGFAHRDVGRVHLALDFECPRCGKRTTGSAAMSIPCMHPWHRARMPERKDPPARRKAEQRIGDFTPTAPPRDRGDEIAATGESDLPIHGDDLAVPDEYADGSAPMPGDRW